MTAPRDADRLISTFLEAGPETLPDHSFDVVRASIDHTRQRAVIGPWKEPHMSTIGRLVLVAAAIVLVIAAGLLTGIGRPSRTAIPLPRDGALEPGTYRITEAEAGRGFTVDVPAGWSAFETSFLLKGLSDHSTSVATFSPWIVTHVYADGCTTSDGPVAVAGTREAIVAALRALPARRATTPVERTIDGHPATQVTLTVPTDVQTCPAAMVRNWPDPGGFTLGGYFSLRGQVDEMIVVDLGDQIMVLAAGYQPEATPADIKALHDIVDSIRFDPPPPDPTAAGS